MDREQLVEKMAGAIWATYGWDARNFPQQPESTKKHWRKQAGAALAVAEPVVREEEREACAKAATNADLPEDYRWGEDARESFDFGKERAAAAIRARNPA